MEWPSTARRQTNEPSWSPRASATTRSCSCTTYSLSLTLTWHMGRRRAACCWWARMPRCSARRQRSHKLSTEVQVHRGRRNRWSPHKVCGASSSYALHLGKHVVRHRRRLGSSAPSYPSYKYIQVGSVIYSSNFLFIYWSSVLFFHRSQVDNQRGVTCCNILHRRSWSPESLFLQCNSAFSLSDSSYLLLSLAYKVNSVPPWSLLCKYYIIFVYLQVWATEAESITRPVASGNANSWHPMCL